MSGVVVAPGRAPAPTAPVARRDPARALRATRGCVAHAPTPSRHPAPRASAPANPSRTRGGEGESPPPARVTHHRQSPRATGSPPASHLTPRPLPASFPPSVADALGGRGKPPTSPRAVSSVASPPQTAPGPREARPLGEFPQDKAPFASSSATSASQHSGAFCELSEEEDLRARVIITMEPGAVVTCTPEEEAIFATLLDVVKTYDLPVTLRVAGGWVRDKLLGKNSTDIDVALDCMMGEEFAVKVNEYLAARGEETHGVGVIQSNPDQSKHLETATMRVHGVWLDLVNLRCESYTEGSRIPRAEFGTAEDDAARRDLTINSLFYNINERKVEDFTGKGLDDLQAGVVRTPLPPLETFTDDPLRILRSVRFASRFGFSLDDAIARAATNPEVQTKLRLKVSRERVGKEVQSMLRGPSPGDALTLLCRFGLYDVVFASGSTPAAAGDLAASLPTAAPWGCLHAARCLDAVLSAHANLRSEPSFYTKTLTAEERECLVLASFLSPLHDGWVANPRGAARGSSPVRLGSKRTKHVPIVREIIKEGLKLRGKDADAVCTILDVAGVMRETFFEHAEKPPSEAASGASSSVSESLSSEAREYASPLPSRVVLGRLLRRSKDLWRLALTTAAVLEMPGVVVLGTGAELESWAVELARGPPCASPLVAGGGSSPGGGSPLHAFAATSLGGRARRGSTTRAGRRAGSRGRGRAGAARSRRRGRGGGGGVGGVLGRQARAGREGGDARRRVDQGRARDEGVHGQARRLAARTPGGGGGGGGGVREKHRRGGQGRVQGVNAKGGKEAERTEPNRGPDPDEEDPDEEDGRG